MSISAFRTDYTTRLRPTLERHRAPARRALILFGTVALIVVIGLPAAVLTDRDVPPWLLAAGAVTFVLSAAYAWQQLQGFSRSFRQTTMRALVGAVSPGAAYDPAGALPRDVLTRAGFDVGALVDMTDLVRSEAACRVPVASCGLVVRRRDEVLPPGSSRVLFRGTLVEAGLAIPAATPVVVARAGHERRLQPAAGGHDLVPVSLGDPALDRALAVWAVSADAAQAAVPPMVARQLAGVVAEAGVELAVDRDGVVALLDQAPVALDIHPLAALPGDDAMRAEAGRLALVTRLVDAFAATRRYPPRPLVAFEGTLAPAAGGGPGRATPEWAAALDTLAAAGIDVDAREDRIVLRYPPSRALWFNLLTVVVFVWLAAAIANAAGALPGGTLVRAPLVAIAAVLGEAAVEWLVAWHPWSTLVSASSLVSFASHLLAGRVREAEISRRGAEVWHGVLRRRRSRTHTADDLVRVEGGQVVIGPPRLPIVRVTPFLAPGVAAAAARAVGGFLDLPVVIPAGQG